MCFLAKLVKKAFGVNFSLWQSYKIFCSLRRNATICSVLQVVGLHSEFHAVDEFLDMKFRYQRSWDKSHCSPFREARLCFRMACSTVLYSDLPSFKDFSPKYIQLLENLC